MTIGNNQVEKIINKAITHEDHGKDWSLPREGKDGCIELTREHFEWLLVSHQYQHTDSLTPKEYSAFH